LADIFLKLQSEGAENINLVSPTIYIDKIVLSINIAREKGFRLPIVYNSNGYESLETLKKLDGLIDIYLPDLKYSDNALALKYSKVQNYFEIATIAIKEMERQVGIPKFDKNGIMKKGVIVRHLILPNYIENTKNVLKWFADNMRRETYISVMTQYFPTYKSNNYPDINRKINKKEYQEIEDYIYEINIQNGYMQDLEDEVEEKYVPKWEC